MWPTFHSQRGDFSFTFTFTGVLAARHTTTRSMAATRGRRKSHKVHKEGTTREASRSVAPARAPSDEHRMGGRGRGRGVKIERETPNGVQAEGVRRRQARRHILQRTAFSTTHRTHGRHVHRNCVKAPTRVPVPPPCARRTRVFLKAYIRLNGS